MTDSFDQLLGQLHQQLSTAASRTKGGTDAQGAAGAETAEPEVPDVETTATALDEQVRVTMSGNRFTALKIDARAMRQTNDELAEHVLEAFNRVMEQHSRALADAYLADNSTDFGALAADVRTMQSQSVEAMRTYTESLYSALDQARRHGT